MYFQLAKYIHKIYNNIIFKKGVIIVRMIVLNSIENK